MTQTNTTASRELATLQASADQSLANAYSTIPAFENAQRVAQMLAQADFVPNQYKGKVANCLIALNMAARMRVDPLMVMQNLHTVYGKPGLSSAFLIGLVNTSNDFKGRMRFEYSGEGDNRSCRAVATCAYTGKDLEGTTISIAMAKAEGWFDRKSKEGGVASKWSTMPDQMLAYRAAAFWARLYAPDLGFGMLTADELEDTTGPIDVTPERAPVKASDIVQTPVDDVSDAEGDATAPLDAQPQAEKPKAAQKRSEKVAEKKADPPNKEPEKGESGELLPGDAPLDDLMEEIKKNIDACNVPQALVRVQNRVKKTSLTPAQRSTVGDWIDKRYRQISDPIE